MLVKIDVISAGYENGRCLVSSQCPFQLLPAGFDPLARHPHVIAMDIAELANVLERAWRHALPGHQAVERDAVLRELWRKLQESKAPVRFVKAGY
jgi:hypothetical protein